METSVSTRTLLRRRPPLRARRRRWTRRFFAREAAWYPRCVSNRDDITRLLRAASGDSQSEEALYGAVYDQLRAVASRQLRAERDGHTLETTALVNEAYLKLVDQRNVDWQNRAHFFAIASRAIRRILVDYARRRRRDKRGGGDAHRSLTDALHVAAEESEIDVVALDDALTRLREEDPVKCEVVEMRYFGGLTNQEVASVLNVSPRTVDRHWSYARAWLFRHLEGTQADD